MKLWKIKYTCYNKNYTRLRNPEILSVGKTAEEAIAKAIESGLEYDARNFKAEEISNVFGFKIIVEDTEDA